MKFYTKVLILLFSTLFLSNALASEDITGTWQGKLSPAPGSELIIQFVITENADGSLSVVLNSPDQGAIKNIKASSVVYDSGKLTMDVTELSGAYEGTVKDGKIEGNWKQEGTSLPLNLKPYEKPVLTKKDMDVLMGSWHGPLEIPSGALTIVLRFEMNEKGEFKTFLDSPDQGATGIPVSDVELVDGTLSIKIPSVRAEYKGKLADDKITGEFKQGGQPLPLTLKKGEYKAPALALDLPKEIMEQLSGEWYGPLKTPAATLSIVFKFATTEKGEFAGFLDSPDQGAKGIPVTEANFNDGKLTIKVKVVQAEFKGQLADKELTGEWSQAGASSMPLLLKKGKYIPPVYSLDLPRETIEVLAGQWKGKLGNYNIVFRFEKNEKGELLGFIDNTDAGARGVQITEASLSDGKLILKVKLVNGEFKGELSDGSLTGEWKQSGQPAPAPLTLKKD